jgi:hypothetical protein
LNAAAVRSVGEMASAKFRMSRLNKSDHVRLDQ